MTNKERRQFPRYTVPGKTIAITPHNLGQVLDISLDGCAIKYIGEDTLLNSNDYIDILMKEAKNKGFYLEKIPINMVWENSPDFSAFSTIVVKKVGMKFKELSAIQQQELQIFIENYGIAEA
nr:PilZ domain-containing protein [Desulfobulbaceae bacterium]